MKIDEAKQLCDGEPPEMTEKLLRLFPKDIGEYTREDFLEGTDPYDYLLLYKEDPFKLERMRQRLEMAARKVGVKNFSKIFKEYCTMHGEDVVEFNVTNFPEQPLTLRCGNYTCDQRGVKLDTELICPHPILMIARFVSIDTGKTTPKRSKILPYVITNHYPVFINRSESEQRENGNFCAPFCPAQGQKTQALSGSVGGTPSVRLFYCSSSFFRRSSSARSKAG